MLIIIEMAFIVREVSDYSFPKTAAINLIKTIQTLMEFLTLIQSLEILFIQILIETVGKEGIPKQTPPFETPPFVV